MKYLIRNSLFIFSIASAAACGHAEIVIGQSAPLTGKNAAFGQDIRRGAMAYFNGVNLNGGINGQKITLTTLDDGNDAKQSGINAKALIEEHDAIALFGFASATLSVPALPLAKTHSMPMFAPFTGADVIHQQTSNIFTVRASYREEMQGILDIWKGYYKSLVVIHYDDAIGRQNFEALAEMMLPSGIKPEGVAIKRNEVVSAGTIAKIQSFKPQVVLFTTLADPIVTIVHDLKSRGEYYGFSSLSFAGPDILKDALGADGPGMAMATVVPMYSKVAVPVVKEYELAMARDGNNTLSFTSLEAFIAAKALAEGIKRAGANPTRKGLLKSLESMHKLDVGGYSLSFSAGQPHGSKFVNVAVVGSNGNFK